MKCTRCGHTMGEPKENWVTCPKCGMSAFVEVKKAPKVEEDVEEIVEEVEEEEEE